MNNLLTAERVVLESLSRKSKTFDDLMEDTDIDVKILKNIVDEFIHQKCIRIEDGHYCLISKYCTNNPVALQLEINAILSDMINASLAHEGNFNLRKVWLTPYEKIFFDSLMQKLHKFFDDVKKKDNQLKTCIQEVVVWGNAPYSQLIKRSVHYSK